MAVHIRLSRVGRRKKPLFRVVAASSEKPRDGRFLEVLGTYDVKKEKGLNIKRERLDFWLKNGAKLTRIIHQLLKRESVLKNLAGKNAT